MSDFEPTAIARQVEPVAKLLEAREALANLTRYLNNPPVSDAVRMPMHYNIQF